jgi:hypothetical protein
MPEGRSLEGWSPVIGVDAALEEVVELAFDYRGDVTVTRADGSSVTGYVYNRDRWAAEPFLEMLDPGGASHRIRYAEVRGIAFTGKDAAAGRSYEAWVRRRAEGRAETPSVPGA